MRYRVTHLLVLGAFVAVFAAAFAKPYPIGNRIFPILSWFIYAAIVCRAVASRRDRPAMLAALMVGGSYLAISLSWGHDRQDWLPSRLLEDIGERLDFGQSSETGFSHNSQVLKFQEIGHHALSLVFALVAAAVTAHWARREDATKD
jgi:hypothetical protein